MRSVWLYFTSGQLNQKLAYKTTLTSQFLPPPGGIAIRRVCLFVAWFVRWCVRYVQYTPPTPTRRNCRVASCWRCEHTRRQSWPNLQFPVLTTDKWRHNDVIVENIVKKFTNITLHSRFECLQTCSVICYVISYFYSIGCRIVNLVTAIGCVHIAESVGSRRELVVNSCTHRRRRRDATKQFRRVGVGGVYWALVCSFVSSHPVTGCNSRLAAGRSAVGVVRAWQR